MPYGDGEAVVSSMSARTSFGIYLMSETELFRLRYQDTGFTASYAFDPLSNLVFTRDQQITTRKGIVMSRLRSAQVMCGD